MEANVGKTAALARCSNHTFPPSHPPTSFLFAGHQTEGNSEVLTELHCKIIAVKNQAALAYKTATLPGKENASGKPLFPLA